MSLPLGSVAEGVCHSTFGCPLGEAGVALGGRDSQGTNLVQYSERNYRKQSIFERQSTGIQLALLALLAVAVPGGHLMAAAGGYRRAALGWHTWPGGPVGDGGPARAAKGPPLSAISGGPTHPPPRPTRP